MHSVYKNLLRLFFVCAGLTLALVFCTPLLFGGQISDSQAYGQTVYEIHFSGLEKTKPFVVKREFLFWEGDQLEEQKYKETIQRLWNLQIFYLINPSFERQKNGRIILHIEFKERWTVIPLVRFVGGGEVSQFVLGLYDVNLFGRYHELGGQIEVLGGALSERIWYGNARFLDTRMRFNVEAANLKRIRALYFNNEEHSRLRGAFNHERVRFANTWMYEFTPILFLNFGFEINQEHLTENQLTETHRKKNREFESLPADANGRSIIASLGLTLGRLNTKDFLSYGIRHKFLIEESNTIWGSELPFHRYFWESVYYTLLPLESNFGVRVTAAHSTAKAIQHTYFIGGLENVRGYLDGRFQDQSFWQTNLEYRIPSIHTPWLVVQHTAFFDIAGVSNRPAGFFESNHKPFASAGLGLRFLCPKIYQMMFRLDYGFAFDSRGSQGIAFGGSQFF